VTSFDRTSFKDVLLASCFKSVFRHPFVHMYMYVAHLVVYYTNEMAFFGLVGTLTRSELKLSVYWQWHYTKVSTRLNQLLLYF
jgi:hypothetical protein